MRSCARATRPRAAMFLLAAAVLLQAIVSDAAPATQKQVSRETLRSSPGFIPSKLHMFCPNA